MAGPYTDVDVSSLSTSAGLVHAAAFSSTYLPTPSGASTANATEPYTHGLTGVNQIGNYFFINMLVIFFSVLFSILFVTHCVKTLTNYWRYLRAAGAGAQRQACLKTNWTAIWPWLNRHILLEPLFGTRHNSDMTLKISGHIISFGTLPLRFPTIILVLYGISNIAYCMVLDYSQAQRAATIAELRGRSGALAAMNLIPTVLFAMRNNPLIWILGISYDTFNLFHRWCARTVILLSVIHVSAWASVSLEQHGRIAELLKHYTSLRFGAVAMVVFLIIAVQAWCPVRRAFYETFLTAHRLLVLFALIGVYVHLDKGRLPQLPYVWLVMIIWIMEWTVRSWRIWRASCSLKEQTMVTVEALPGEACRLTFDLIRPWTYQPGSHAYIMIPSIELSMHPFSVAWSTTNPPTNPFDDDFFEIELDDLEKGKPTARTVTTQTSPTSPPQPKTKLTLIIRARAGFTRKLFAHAFASATTSPHTPLTLPAYIDGPYGDRANLDSFGTVLLFAGGIGITHQLGYVRHLLSGHANKTVAVQKLVLVWSVPSMQCLQWVQLQLDAILGMQSYRSVLQIKVFVTRMGEGERVNMASSSRAVQIVSERCDVGGTVDEVFRARVGGMCVMVCGPGAFGDGVRDVVKGRVEEGSLEFVEEGFSY